ncbi:hypothetical protein [Burkholderia anthina]|nr:hypothetical protein [Burkholderia anthina]
MIEATGTKKSKNPKAPTLFPNEMIDPVQNTFNTVLFVNSIPCYQPFGS